MQTTMQTTQLTVKEKVAYGLGDTASNIIFQTVMLFLTFFYTDIFGIPAAVVGTMFLVVRILDAVTDPLMGALADRTQTRWGKYRPYLLWMALPFGFISVLTFTTPEFQQTGKIIYAYFTYILLMAVYTLINIPYSALGGVLTGDPQQRVSVQGYRFVFGMLGGLIVTAGTLPLVEWLGDGDKAKGYQLTMLLMSSFGVLLFLLCFAGTRERVAPPKEQKMTFRQSLSALWQNEPWRVLCLAACILLTGMVLRNTLSIYYVKYFLEREDLITTFVTLGMIGNILGCACAQPLSRYVEKVKAYISLQLIAGLICVASFFVPATQVELAFTLYFLWGFFLQMATPLLWAKMADVVDYGQWKTGLRITGLVYSSIVFFIKFGLALGGALAGWLLAFYGYQADISQSETTRQGILLSFTLLPALSFVLVAVVMRWYPLHNQKVMAIHQALTEKSVTR
ncbi:glycoside-pentoside-hexuronide (GPH):cation symporter [Chromatiaceae bacterium AAb-1]|nr:glycoside-pentoside-hexuronide (GPH):cation symporter [Chromatiaceae bacterium AAb-1]